MVTSLDDIIELAKEKHRLEAKINDDVHTIKSLDSAIFCKVHDIVHEICDVDEMIAFCEEHKLPTNTWWFKRAMENENSRCPDHEKSMWYDVLSTVTDDLVDKIENTNKNSEV